MSYVFILDTRFDHRLCWLGNRESLSFKRIKEYCLGKWCSWFNL